MSDPRPPYISADGEINFREFFQVIWSGKLVITTTAALAAVISITVALSTPNIYESTAVLTSRSDSGTGGLAGLAAQYGAFASLAGVDLAGVRGDRMPKASLALEKMKSLEFFRQHLYEDLLADLMAVKLWNPSTGRIEYDSEIFDVSSQKWLREVTPQRQAKPSFQEAHKVFRSHFSVVEDQRTGLIVIRVRHQSPEVAKHWAELMINRVSEDLRGEDIREAQGSIKFLEAQREKTSLVTLDGVFAQLIEEQTKTIMLANVSRDYVFDVIDPPVVPEIKIEPARAIICISGTLLGAMLGVMIVLVRYYLFREAQTN